MIDLIFVLSPSNKNSFAALCGALDTVPKIKENFNLKLVNEENIINELSSGKTKIACFSFQTPDIFRLSPLIKRIKKITPKTILIAGGAHSSGAPHHTLNMGFDYVFVGEGEEIFINFLKNYLLEKNNSKRILVAPKNSVDILKFLPVSQGFPLFTPIEITRGCPYGCRFCQTTYLFGKIKHRSINQIVKATKILREHGWKHIRFVSPNILSYGSKDGFKPNLTKLEKMLISVKKVKGVKKIYAGSFPSEVRPENVSKKALLILRRYCDNNNIIIGFQSGSDSVLKRMRRGHTVKEALRSVEVALEIGFKVNVDFIFGNPHETEKEEEETIKVLKELAKFPNLKIHGHTFLPLPGTPWGKEKPSKISPKLKEFLKSLEISKKLYGDWEKQERLGKKFYKLINRI